MLFPVACSRAEPLITDQNTPMPVSPSPTAIIPTIINATETPNPLLQIPGSTLDELRNSEYQLGFFDQIRSVKLKDGRYQEGAELCH